MQVVIQLVLNEVIDELIDTHTAGRAHVFRTQLHFCLALEYRFFHIDSDGAYYTITDVGQFLVLIEELLDGTSDGLAVSGLMGTSLDGMLAVDE